MILEKVNLICTKCPVGCMLQLDVNDDNILVSGNSCKAGEQYGVSEYTNPVRTITTSIKMHTKNGVEIISVKTNKEVPKNRVFDCIKEIKMILLKKDSIEIGDTVLENILGLNVDVVATRSYCG